MKLSTKRLSAGFTIIETIIVLAIAGVILLIVFLVVPALNRNSRNYSRKNAVNYVLAEVNEYYVSHNTFPYMGLGTPDNRVSFVNDLKAQGPAKVYTIDYSDSYHSHSLPYDNGWDVSQDTITIMPGHFCQRTPGYNQYSGGDYPFMGSSTTSDNYNFFAVSIVMENTDHTSYCVDNSNSN